MPAVVLWDSIKIYLVVDMYIKISFLWGKEYDTQTLQDMQEYKSMVLTNR